MLPDWITASSSDIIMTLVSSVATYVAIITFTRLTGLRSFSKMSAADFAMTVAVGSLFAATISSPKPSLAVGALALACLFGGQHLVARFRQRFDSFARLVDNRPVLLMAGREFIEPHLRVTQVTRSDIYAKLREANVRNYDEIVAVVFEATGDVSVIHASEEVPIEFDILQDIVGVERLRDALARPRRPLRG